MPIRTSSPVFPPTRETFHGLDHLVTGLAFEIHNDMGRLLDESVYQAELARRCSEKGVTAEREVRIEVSHGNFSKDYFIDLLLASGVVVETKTTERLLPRHKSQVLNYLFLTSLSNGNILNFRTPRVQHEFVSTKHTPASRRVRTIDVGAWECLCPNMVGLQEIMLGLLDDWGCGLDVTLYRDGAIHLLHGGQDEPVPVAVRSHGCDLGCHKMHLLAEDIAFVATSTRDHSQTAAHLLRLLTHTKLQAIAWVNLHHTNVRFTTLLQPTT